MSAVALFRDYELPWTPSEEEQRRLRRILGAVLGLFIAFGVIIPLLPAPPKSTAPPVLPERVVESLLDCAHRSNTGRISTWPNAAAG